MPLRQQRSRIVRQRIAHLCAKGNRRLTIPPFLLILSLGSIHPTGGV